MLAPRPGAFRTLRRGISAARFLQELETFSPKNLSHLNFESLFRFSFMGVIFYAFRGKFAVPSICIYHNRE